MKCPKCGADTSESAKFCGSCGAPLSATEKAQFVQCPKCGACMPKDAEFCGSCGVALSENAARSRRPEKLPVYLRVWCSLLLSAFLAGLFQSAWGLLLFPFLFFNRLSAYPERRKGAWMELTLTLALCAAAGYGLQYLMDADRRTVNQYIQNGNYEEALAFVEERFDPSDYAYYKAQADIFEASGNLNKAAESILNYCGQADDLTALNADAEKRLTRYQENVSENLSTLIDRIAARIESAKEEKAEARANTDTTKGESVQLEEEFPTSSMAEEFLVQIFYIRELASYHITPNHQSDRNAMPRKIVETLSGEPHYARDADDGVWDRLLGNYYVAISNAPGSYVYYGETKNNRPDGFGVLCSNYIDLNDVTTYVNLISAGTFSQGLLNGYGAYFETDYVAYRVNSVVNSMLVCDGSYQNGEMNGKGNHFQKLCDGDNIMLVTSVSDFKNGNETGMSKRYYGNTIFYDGEVKDGQRHGHGTSYYLSTGKTEYEGEWKSGKYDGTGVLYDKNGNKVYSGKWRDGDYAT